MTSRILENPLQAFMKGAVALLAIAFIFISFWGMLHIREQAELGPDMKLDSSLVLKLNAGMKPEHEQQVIAGLMESYIVGSRYHQAKILMMINVWTQYFGFLTGMILALIGSVFILGKIKEDVSKIDLKNVLKFTITSSSPGIILSFLGTALMLFTINVKHQYSIKDDAVYLRPPVSVHVEGDKKPGSPAEWNSGNPHDSAEADTNEIEKKKQELKNKYKHAKPSS